MTKIHVLQAEITVKSLEQGDFISLSDMARFKDPARSDYIIQNWLRNRTTIEFLGLWEQLNNPAFKSIEFDGFRTQAGLNSFVLTPKQWIEKTGAIQDHLIPVTLTKAQAPTLVGEASPSLQPPRRRWSMNKVGGCGVLRYPLSGMLRPATPSNQLKAA